LKKPKDKGYNDKEAEFYSLAALLGSYHISSKAMLYMLHRFFLNKTYREIAKDYGVRKQAPHSVVTYHIKKIRLLTK